MVILLHSGQSSLTRQQANSQYIQEGKTLAALMLNKDMTFSMVQAFIDRLNNYKHKQILDLILLDNLYTFQKVKIVVQKLHSHSLGIMSIFTYLTIATNI